MTSSSPSNLPPLQTVFSSHERPRPALYSNPSSHTSTPKSASPAASRMKSSDPLLSRLTPATITKMSDLDFMPGEKEVGVWAATSAEKIESWLREVESWEMLTYWSKKGGSGFKVPDEPEQRKKRRKIDLSKAIEDRQRPAKTASLPVARRLFTEATASKGSGIQLDKKTAETISLSKIDELLSPTTTPLPVKRLDLDLPGTPTTPSRMYSAMNAPMSPFDKSSKRRSLQVTGLGNGGQSLVTTPTPLKRQTYDFSPSHRLSNSISAAHYRPTSSPTKPNDNNDSLNIQQPASTHLSPYPTPVLDPATDSEADGQTSDSEVEDADGAEFLGSLSTNTANHISNRVATISIELSQLDIEGLKSRVLHFKSQQIDEDGHGHMSDSLAVITATTLQLLPPLHRLWHLLETWGWRVEVCRVVPTFLANLEKAEGIVMRGNDEGAGWANEVASAVGDEAVNEGTLRTLEGGVDEVWEKRRTEVANTVGLCGKIIDGMLDLLDGREETIPDEWIDRLEAVEGAMENWIFEEGSKAEQLKRGWRGVIRRKREEEERLRRELLERLRREEEERLKKEEEDRLRRLEEQRLRREEEKRLRKEEEERLRKEEEVRLKREEEERLRKEEERLRKEEEERTRLEELEQLRKAEEERIRQAEEEERLRREAEEERLRQEEAERIRLEQEAIAKKAEEARQRQLIEEESARVLAEEEEKRRKAEEARIRELEERQRLKYEEMERLEQAAVEEEAKQKALEEEARQKALEEEAQKQALGVQHVLKDKVIAFENTEELVAEVSGTVSADHERELVEEDKSTTEHTLNISDTELASTSEDPRNISEAIYRPPSADHLLREAEVTSEGQVVKILPSISEADVVEANDAEVEAYQAIDRTVANNIREAEITGDGGIVEIMPVISENEDAEMEQEELAKALPMQAIVGSPLQLTAPVPEVIALVGDKQTQLSHLPRQMQVPILTPIMEVLTPAALLEDPLAEEVNTKAELVQAIQATPAVMLSVVETPKPAADDMKLSTEPDIPSQDETIADAAPDTKPLMNENSTISDNSSVRAESEAEDSVSHTATIVEEEEPRNSPVTSEAEGLAEKLHFKDVQPTEEPSEPIEPELLPNEVQMELTTQVEFKPEPQAPSDEKRADPASFKTNDREISTSNDIVSTGPAETGPVYLLHNSEPEIKPSAHEEAASERSVSPVASLPGPIPIMQIEGATPIEGPSSEAAVVTQLESSVPNPSPLPNVDIEGQSNKDKTEVLSQHSPPSLSSESDSEVQAEALNTPAIEVTIPEEIVNADLIPMIAAKPLHESNTLAQVSPISEIVAETTESTARVETSGQTSDEDIVTSQTIVVHKSAKQILGESRPESAGETSVAPPKTPRSLKSETKEVKDFVQYKTSRSWTHVRPSDPLKSEVEKGSKAQKVSPKPETIVPASADEYVSDVDDDSDAATVSDDEEFQAELRKERLKDEPAYRRGSEISITSNVSSIAEEPVTPQIKTPDTRFKRDREATVTGISPLKSKDQISGDGSGESYKYPSAIVDPKTPQRASTTETPKLSSPFLPVLGGPSRVDAPRHDPFDSIASRTGAHDLSFSSLNSLEVAREVTSPLSPTGSVIIRRDSNSFGASFSSVFSDDTIPDVANGDIGGLLDDEDDDDIVKFRPASPASVSTDVSPIKEEFGDNRFRYSLSSDGSNVRLEEPETSPIKKHAFPISRNEARGQPAKPTARPQKQRQSSISSISSSTSGRSSRTSERPARPVQPQAQTQATRHIRHVSSIPTIAPPRKSLQKDTNAYTPQHPSSSHSHSQSVSQIREKEDKPIYQSHRPTASVSAIPRKPSYNQIATPVPTTRMADKNEITSVRKRSSLIGTRDLTPKASAQELRNVPSRGSSMRPSSVASLRGQSSRQSMRGPPSNTHDPISPTMGYSVRSQTSRHSLRSSTPAQLPAQQMSPTYDPNQAIKVVKRKSAMVSKPQIHVPHGRARDNGTISPISPTEFPAINPVMGLHSTPMKGRDLEDRLERKINKILIGLPSLTMTPSPMKRAPLAINTSMEPPMRQPKFGESKLPIPRVPSTPTIGQAPNLTLSSKRTISQPGEVKMYHLHRSDEESPVKLFVRLVGDKGERVMVRVGGGWADLKEYLIEYAAHHGIQSQRRMVSESVVEFGDDARSLKASNSNSSLRSSYRRSPTPTFNSRPNSPLPGGVKVPVPTTSRGTTPNRAESPALVNAKGSPGLRLGGGHSMQNMKVPQPRDSPTTPSHDRPGTPGSAGIHPLYTSPSYSGGLSANYRRPTSRLSFGGEGLPMDSDSPTLSPISSVPLGLAGPKGRNVEISAEKQAWVDGMLGQVRKASAERNVRLGLNHFGSVGSLQGGEEESGPSSNGSPSVGARLAELGKVGSTKRMYMTKQSSYASLQKGLRSSSSNLGRATPGGDRERDGDNGKSGSKGLH